MTSDVFVFPASFAQQRLWFLDRFLPGNAFYNMPSVVSLPQTLDVDVLRRSLAELVRRHESLRTTFGVVEEVPVQVIAATLDVPLTTIDLCALSPSARESEKRRLVAEEGARPFDLARGPLLRATLLRLGDEGDVLLLTLHHIISDGWSMKVLFRELSAFYEAIAADQPSGLPELAVQYADFAVWQRQWLRDDVLDRQMAYWRHHLAGAPAWLDLPADRPRPKSASLHAATRTIRWSADRSEVAREFAHRERSTVFLVLLAALTALLARYSGQDDIVIGTPVANRVATETEPLIGFFVNTLALRSSLAGDPTFIELLGRVRDTVEGAFANQDVPFEHVVAEVAPERTLNRSPLFQVMFTLQSEVAEPGRRSQDGDADGGNWDGAAGAAKFDLTLSLADRGGEISGWLEYAADLFDAPTVERLLDNFGRLADDALRRPDARISTLAMLSDVERTRLVDDWNATATEYPRDSTVHELFEAQANVTPHAIAVTYGAASITYHDLNSRANQLARHLAARGIGRDSLVGVLMPPSIEMVVAFVAVLKAGGAYVPLDSGDPPDRVRFMLRDAEARVVVTLAPHGSVVRELDEGVAVVYLDTDAADISRHEATNADRHVRADDLAYVIYTSGSTGEPKGVAVEHRAIIRLVRNTDYLDFSRPAVFAQMSHPSFDAATFEIWGALLSGARLVGIPRTVALSPRELSEAIRGNGITTLFITTALFNQVAAEAPDAFRGVRDLLSGGEANDPRSWQRVLEHSRPSRLLHVYGPTECTTFATWHRVSDVAEDVTNVPIGRPVANTRAYVLDEHAEPVPTGAPGELYLGGDGIARGYWRRPELTAERFVPDRFGSDPSARLYRTGDLVRQRSDGALLFLGRRDEQVKIRGFRIELGEVETALRAHPAVRDAAVLVRVDGTNEKGLTAYLARRDAGEPLPGDATVRAFVQQRLPAWMAPSRFIWVEALPLTPSGKVDRQALTHVTGQAAVREAIEELNTPTERKIGEIWQELLAVPTVGAGDRFFEIGGHSLLAAQVVARVRDRLRVEVSVRSLFEAPMLRDFAEAVDQERARTGELAALTAAPLVHRTGSGPRKTSFAQQRLWFIAQLEPASAVYNVPDVIALGAIDEDLVRCALAEIVRRHDVLRTTIVAVDGIPMQMIAPECDLQLPCDDLRALSHAERAQAYEIASAELAERPFDLAQGPLVRARLVRLAEEDSRLLLAFHHAIADGWSLQVLRAEMDGLLDAFTRGRPSPLADLAVQYADYAEWQRERLNGDALDQLLAYWSGQLAGAPPSIQLPSDRPRPAAQTYAGATLSTRVPDGVARGLQALSTQHGTTVFTTVLASFAVLLARYSGQRDIVVGTPVAGRTHTELEPLIGLFVNTLALRIDVTGDASFEALLTRVRQTVLEAFAHQDLPFDRLVSELAPARHPGVSPLVQVLFDFQRRPLEHLSIRSGETIASSASVAKFDLTLVMTEDADGLVASLEHNTDLFDSTSVRRMLQNFLQLLAAIVDDPTCSCSCLRILAEPERHLLLSEWSAGNEAPGRRERCLPALVESRVRESPDAISVLTDAGDLTYAQLDLAATRVAARLRLFGVEISEPVGLCLDRTRELLVGMLGILKAGSAYVPLDPSHPPERLNDLLRDAGARVVVTQPSLAPMWPLPVTAVCVGAEGETALASGTFARRSAAADLDSADETGMTPAGLPLPGSSGHHRCVCGADSLAAIVYTSGSTGRPKGVAVEHQSLVNLAAAIAQKYELVPTDRVLHMTGLAFDVAAEEIFPTLASGAAIVPWPDRMPPTIDEVLAFVDRFQITVLNLASPYWHALTDALRAQQRQLPSSVRLVVAGSDKTSIDRLLAWQQHVSGPVRWLNAYGTTETTVTSTVYEPAVPAARGATPWVPIGRPIAGVQAYVLDEHGEPLPVGAPGELFIGGAGVARGYVGLPEVTAQRFVPDPFSGVPGARMHATGDRARFRADGDLELLGRFDDQVKIRGFRIAPAEVEHVLMEHSDIRDVTVVSRQDRADNPRLVAYFVPRHWPGPSSTDLRALLRRRVPDYMIPAAYVAIAELPTTSAGKVDRARLPEPVPDADADRSYVPPRTATERQLAQVWAQVLGVERVGVTDNFFELGGDSILSIQIIARASQLGLRYTPRQLFEHQTIAQLAPLAGTGIAIVAEQGPVTGPVALTPVQRWFFEQAPVDPHHYNQSVLLFLDGTADATLLERAFAHLVDTHDALRLRFITEGGSVHPMHAPPGGGAFSRLDLSDTPAEEREEALERAATACQASLSIAAGPIARALFIRLDRSSRLLLVVHHLAVDGVSWRIILDDLYAAYDQLARGETISLPPKTTSFQHWARRLVEHGHSAALRLEAGFWQAFAHRTFEPLPLDRVAGRDLNTEASARVVTFALEASETDALLHRVPHAYRTQINDILLCALARGFRSWTGHRELLIDLEGHGREPLFDDVDLSRTVGWFTTIFPVIIDGGEETSVGAAIKAVKEHLRQLPHKGIGFGLLRYLCPDPSVRAALRTVPAAEVSFNYLGQFEDTHAPEHAPRIAAEWGGPQRSPRGLRPYLLDITAGVYEGRLTLSFMYSAAHHDRSTMEVLCARVARALRELIEHCVAADGRDCTPSDFPLAQLDQPLLNRLLAAHGAIEDIYPLSPMQAGLLFHTLLAPDAGEYVELIALDLHRDIDVAALRRAWTTVVDRHPVLRSAFVWSDVAEPLQVVRRAVPLAWEVRDWSTADEAVARTLTEDWLRQDRRSGYDLGAPPLMRFAMAKLPSAQWRLFWSCHHIVLDGWSVPLVLREVSHFYEALRDGREAELPHPRPYRDYIAWLGKQDLAAAETFWRGILQGFSTPTPLVVDRARTGAAGSDTHGEARRTLSEHTTSALQAFARQRRLTVNTIVQAAWALILSRYSGQDDIVFGATVSGRPPELPGVEAMVGLFINTLPVRVRVLPDTPVSEWLQSVQHQQSAARQFEFSPLVSVQGWSDVPRGTPLFESVLVFENYPVDPPAAGNDERRDPFYMPALERTSYPLTIAVVPGAQLTVKITYDCERLDRAAVERMLGHFETVLTAVPAMPDARVGSLPLLTSREQEQALFVRNRTASEVPYPTCVHMFDDQVRRTPGATAVVADDASLTYAELNRRAAAVALYLRTQGVGSDVPVGLYLERGPWMMVGLLGIVKAGGAYVPLATSYPIERVGFMLQDSGARVVLTQASLRGRLPAGARTVACLDGDWDIIAASCGDELPQPEPSSIAYIIYTSGSTGQPKGAALPHRALSNLIWWQNTRSTPRPFARVLQFAPVSFDVCFQECFSTWASGGTLVLISDDTQRDPTLLARAIDAHEADRLFLPFVALQQLAETVNETGAARHLAEIITAGEQLHVTPALRRFFSDRLDCTLHNQYGPSETHVATAFTLTGPPATWPDLPPIGWPIANTEVYVLDSAMRPLPVGAPGELYLGGECLAREYWGRPDLTAERFVPHPFEPGARLYRTGDLVRVGQDDALEFLGRLDDQVKIRGFRVEPAEIEAVLRQHPGVGQAVVVATDGRPGDRRLVAYVVPAQSAGSPVADDELRMHVEARLPDWMVPAAFVCLESLPLTPSGKVERRSLPAPNAPVEPDLRLVEPRTSGERALAAIWREILGIPHVGPYDHFFQLGGHSLLATRLVSRIRRQLGIELPLRAVFEAPVLADLARSLNERDGRLAQPAIIPRRAGNEAVPASFGQQRLWLLEQVNRRTLFHIATAIRVSGAVPSDVWRRALNEVVRRHEVLRTTFIAVGGTPVQQIASELDIPLTIDDLRAQPSAARESACREFAGADADASFDLVAGPLVRARLLKLTDTTSELLLTLHHIVADGWSLMILQRELLVIAEAFARSEASPLPELPIQYADFTAWQRERVRGAVIQLDVEYWRQQLAGAPATLDFPTDRPRPPVQSYQGAMLRARVPAVVARELQAFSQREGVTLFMTLLSAFAVLLSRQTGQTDIVVGAPVAGRTQAETELLIGFFLNHLPIRIDLAGEPTFREVVSRVRDAALGAYAHQELPFELLLEQIAPERHTSHTPVFQVFFNMLNFGDVEGSAADVDGDEPIRLEPADAVPAWSPFDFTLYAAEQSTGIELQLVYRTALYDDARMAELLAQFMAVVDQIARQPSAAVRDISLITACSRRRLPDPSAPLDDAWRGAVHTQFAQHAAEHPDRPAVSDDEAAWTYSELEAHSSRVAQQLRGDGIGADDVVAIYAHRSAPLVCAILGVMKAGATFMILDPAYPPARLLEYMELVAPVGWIALERAGAVPDAIEERLGVSPCRSRLVLPRGTRFAAAACVAPPTPPDPVGPDRVACISFTSGSTGKPKGVLQRHGPLTHFVPWTASTFDISHVDRFSMVSGLSHDPLQRDIFTALCLGASIHIPPGDAIGAPGGLAAWFRARDITVAHLTPAMCQLLVQDVSKYGRETHLPALRRVFFVGDKVTKSEVSRLRALAPGAVCVNYYGATETQRAVGYFVDPPGSELAAGANREAAHRSREVLPAGRGIEDVQLLVMTPAGQLAGVGELGEIHVRSPHLARGYHQDSLLTEARFVVNRFTGAKNDLMYRTGDLGRYLPDGMVDFVGRADSQVQVRGFRVELAEVEARLRQHPQIRDVAVLPRGSVTDERRIVAYFVSNAPVSLKDLRRFIAERLPDYMIPSTFVELDALPMTPNGKIDTRRLPEATPRSDRDPAGRRPANDVEETVLLLWEQALHSTVSGVDDNFFELGGHSLLASQVLSRMSDAFCVDIPLGHFFQHPTVAGLAGLVAVAQAQGLHSGRPPLSPIPREKHRARCDAAGRLQIPDTLRQALRDIVGATAPSRRRDVAPSRGERE